MVVPGVEPRIRELLERDDVLLKIFGLINTMPKMFLTDYSENGTLLATVGCVK